MKQIEIPSSFLLGPYKIKVSYEDELHSRTGNSGNCNSYFNDIRLQSLKNGTPREQMEQTFYHEKVHMILDAMERKELSQDEKFVNLFATFLLQTDKTSIQ